MTTQAGQAGPVDLPEASLEDINRPLDAFSKGATALQWIDNLDGTWTVPWLGSTDATISALDKIPTINFDFSNSREKYGPVVTSAARKAVQGLIEATSPETAGEIFKDVTKGIFDITSQEGFGKEAGFGSRSGQVLSNLTISGELDPSVWTYSEGFVTVPEAHLRMVFDGALEGRKADFLEAFGPTVGTQLHQVHLDLANADPHLRRRYEDLFASVGVLSDNRGLLSWLENSGVEPSSDPSIRKEGRRVWQSWNPLRKIDRGDILVIEDPELSRALRKGTKKEVEEAKLSATEKAQNVAGLFGSEIWGDIYNKKRNDYFILALIEAQEEVKTWLEQDKAGRPLQYAGTGLALHQLFLNASNNAVEELISDVGVAASEDWGVKNLPESAFWVIGETIMGAIHLMDRVVPGTGEAPENLLKNYGVSVPPMVQGSVEMVESYYRNFSGDAEGTTGQIADLNERFQIYQSFLQETMETAEAKFRSDSKGVTDTELKAKLWQRALGYEFGNAYGLLGRFQGGQHDSNGRGRFAGAMVGGAAAALITEFPKGLPTNASPQDVFKFSTLLSGATLGDALNPRHSVAKKYAADPENRRKFLQILRPAATPEYIDKIFKHWDNEGMTDLKTAEQKVLGEAKALLEAIAGGVGQRSLQSFAYSTLTDPLIAAGGLKLGLAVSRTAASVIKGYAKQLKGALPKFSLKSAREVLEAQRTIEINARRSGEKQPVPEVMTLKALRRVATDVADDTFEATLELVENLNRSTGSTSISDGVSRAGDLASAIRALSRGLQLARDQGKSKVTSAEGLTVNADVLGLLNVLNEVSGAEGALILLSLTVKYPKGTTLTEISKQARNNLRRLDETATQSRRQALTSAAKNKAARREALRAPGGEAVSKRRARTIETEAISREASSEVKQATKRIASEVDNTLKDWATEQKQIYKDSTRSGVERQEAKGRLDLIAAIQVRMTKENFTDALFRGRDLSEPVTVAPLRKGRRARVDAETSSEMLKRLKKTKSVKFLTEAEAVQLFGRKNATDLGVRGKSWGELVEAIDNSITAEGKAQAARALENIVVNSALEPVKFGKLRKEILTLWGLDKLSKASKGLGISKLIEPGVSKYLNYQAASAYKARYEGARNLARARRRQAEKDFDQVSALSDVDVARYLQGGVQVKKFTHSELLAIERVRSVLLEMQRSMRDLGMIEGAGRFEGTYFPFVRVFAEGSKKARGVTDNKGSTTGTSARPFLHRGEAQASALGEEARAAASILYLLDGLSPKRAHKVKEKMKLDRGFIEKMNAGLVQDALISELPEFFLNGRAMKEASSPSFSLKRLTSAGIHRLVSDLSSVERRELYKLGRVTEALRRQGLRGSRLADEADAAMRDPKIAAELVDSVRDSVTNKLLPTTEAVQNLTLGRVPHYDVMFRNLKLRDIDHGKKYSPVNLLKSAKVEEAKFVVPKIIEQEMANIEIAKVFREMLDDPGVVQWAAEGKPVYFRGFREKAELVEEVFRDSPAVLRVIGRNNAQRPREMKAYIHPTMAKTIKAMAEGQGAALKAMGAVGRFVRGNLTFLNADTTNRNLMSSLEYLQMGGLNIFTKSGAKYYLEASKIVSERGPMYDLLMAEGVVGVSYVDAVSATGGRSAARTISEKLALKAGKDFSRGGERTVAGTASDALILALKGLGEVTFVKGNLRDSASRFYGGLDDTARVAMALKRMAEGHPIRGIGRIVDDVYPNYSSGSVPNRIISEMENNTPFTSHFLKFTFENYRVMLNNLRKRPHLVAANMAFWHTPTVMAKQRYGITDAAMSELLAGYSDPKSGFEVFQDYMSHVALPFGEPYGNVTWDRSNAGAIASVFARPFHRPTDNDAVNYVSGQVLQMFRGSPLVSAFAGLLTGVDPFTGRPIVPEGTPTEVSIPTYLGRTVGRLLVPGRQNRAAYALAMERGASALSSMIAEELPEEREYKSDEDALVMAIRALANAVSPEGKRLRLAETGAENPFLLGKHSFPIEMLRVFGGLKLEHGTDGRRINRIINIADRFSPHGTGVKSANVVEFQDILDNRGEEAALKWAEEKKLGVSWARDQLVQSKRDPFEARVHQIPDLETRYWVFRQAQLAGVSPPNLLKLDMAWRVKALAEYTALYRGTGANTPKMALEYLEDIEILATLLKEKSGVDLRDENGAVVIKDIENRLQGLLRGSRLESAFRELPTLIMIDALFATIGEGTTAPVEAARIIETLRKEALDEARRTEAAGRQRR